MRTPLLSLALINFKLTPFIFNKIKIKKTSQFLEKLYAQSEPLYIGYL
ncbi:hypothetical protein SAMN05444355_106128 [Flavobacterium frigoris]|uniref:Uncharacterized protein n=1 Tax=Flavobacterium frigoris TaxID=229204 RepID=A0A1H9KXC6_FLAFI|nr:hypothetical protein SAMN05444355_106128 [Flavobacterium frigoris]